MSETVAGTLVDVLEKIGDRRVTEGAAIVALSRRESGYFEEFA